MTWRISNLDNNYNIIGDFYSSIDMFLYEFDFYYIVVAY